MMLGVTATDLAEATALAVELVDAAGQPPVIAGALAMAIHGYRRETSDVDIVVPIVIGIDSGDDFEDLARDLGLSVRAKHGFGGLDLRAGEIRIDVLTLDRDVPSLIPEAVEEAVNANRRATVFDQEMFVVSLGHLIAMKLIAERKKDIADIVELIKVRIEDGQWANDRSQVADVVTRHLGWYAMRAIDSYAKAAREELSW